MYIFIYTHIYVCILIYVGVNMMLTQHCNLTIPQLKYIQNQKKPTKTKKNQNKTRVHSLQPRRQFSPELDCAGALILIF